MPGDKSEEIGRKSTKRLLEALVGLAAFCAVSFLGSVSPLGLSAMVLSGIALPLAWGKATGNWSGMGFTRRNAGRAIGWGLVAGVATSLIGLFAVQERSLPTDLGLELAVGVPMWLLVASPFQEFFFRGWLQPRFEARLGKGLGLLAATAGFAAWHYCWPLAEQTSVPLGSLRGAAATFGAGLVYGYSFQCSGSILAPWLAHALSGITFVVVGAGSFIGAMQ